MLVTLVRLIVGTALALVVVACSTPPDTVTSVTIDGGDQRTVLGSVLALTATVATTGNASDAVSWTGSDETVATIDMAGNVTSLAVGSTSITATSTADPSKADSITLTVDPRGVVVWTRQFGTSGPDGAFGVATDTAGAIHLTGLTLGALDGPNAGGTDAFIRSYDGAGNLRWTRQFGTSNVDGGRGIATDANGNVYATGTTLGDLDGTNAGDLDAFIRSYDSDGNLRWTRQFGTHDLDEAVGIATDANGNVYVTGLTFAALAGSSAGLADVYIRSYDSDGNLRWTRQFGSSSNDHASGIATDSNGNVSVAGFTSGALEGPSVNLVDAFIRSYDGDGNVRWTRQFGSDAADYAFGVATDANGNVYVAGNTIGGLEGPNAGGEDAFVRSYDSEGNLRWTRQFGTSSDDFTMGVATDANGNVYAAGYTLGALEGPNAGGEDAFVRSYDRDGNLHWTRQFGTSSTDGALAITTDANANVYVAGAFAAPGRSRRDAGAGYYGALELSGNLWEPPVTVGNAEGQAFAGSHGDGSLDAGGNANVASWPGASAVGAGFRGGRWGDYGVNLRVSLRYGAAIAYGDRDSGPGWRGVRSAP